MKRWLPVVLSIAIVAAVLFCSEYARLSRGYQFDSLKLSPMLSTTPTLSHSSSAGLSLAANGKLDGPALMNATGGPVESNMILTFPNGNKMSLKLNYTLRQYSRELPSIPNTHILKDPYLLITGGLLSDLRRDNISALQCDGRYYRCLIRIVEPTTLNEGDNLSIFVR